VVRAWRDVAGGLVALVAIALLGLGMVGAAPIRAEAAATSAFSLDERLAGYYTIVDEAGNSLLTTGLGVSVGDRFIAEDNREYEVYSVDADNARARPVTGQAGGLSAPAEVPAATPAPGGAVGLDGSTIAAAAGGATVAIYHTHSDESYVPSDGAANIPAHGGIFQVGAAFRDALRRKGLTVVDSTQPHDPHDNLAYDRSRRTALSLLSRYRPAAIFDVHRDTAPPQAYQKKVSGQQVTQVMFVIGRQNPNMQANLAFAKQLKAVADQSHPGLVRAIYFGQGRYNQDLSPRALLIEVGAEDNMKAEAERGVALLADDVPKVVGTAGPSGALGIGGQNRGATRAILTIVAGILLLAAGYLIIASGGFSQAWERLRRLRSTELAGYLNGREGRKVGEKHKGERDKRTVGKGGDEVWMATGRHEDTKEQNEETKDSSRTGGHRDRGGRDSEPRDDRGRS
jgi:stage II sporulation protein P